MNLLLGIFLKRHLVVYSSYKLLHLLLSCWTTIQLYKIFINFPHHSEFNAIHSVASILFPLADTYSHPHLTLLHGTISTSIFSGKIKSTRRTTTLCKSNLLWCLPICMYNSPAAPLAYSPFAPHLIVSCTSRFSLKYSTHMQNPRLLHFENAPCECMW